MAQKQQIQKNIGRLKKIQTWQLIALLILAAFISATFLRLNYIGMTDRWEAVKRADKAGDEREIVSRLYSLQRHVNAHMNTDTVAFLEHSYKRANKAKMEAAVPTQTNIYKQAQEVCAPRFSAYSSEYLQCTMSELQKHPESPEIPDKVDPVDPSLYRYTYSSPLWTPDFAGFSLLAVAGILLLIIGRLISLIVLRLMLKRYYKNV